MSIDALKDRLPEYARDLKLNLSSLASEQLLSAAAEGRQLHRCRARRQPCADHAAVVDAFAPRALARGAERRQDRGVADGDEQRLLPLRAPGARGRLQDPAGQLRMTAWPSPASTRSTSSCGRWPSRRSTAAACAWRRTRRCCATTACPPSRSRPRCASPRRSMPPPAPWRPKRLCDAAGAGGLAPLAVAAPRSVTTAGQDFVCPAPRSSVDRAQDPPQDHLSLPPSPSGWAASADAASAGEPRSPPDSRAWLTVTPDATRDLGARCLRQCRRDRHIPGP